jgi:adenosine deaminase/aminodeoxyfutalosine deaminase
VFEDFLHLPKAELHVHLEGSVEPETLREIDPSLAPEEVEAGYRYSDFLGFLKAYAWVATRLVKPEHYAIATRRLLEKLHSQGVSYAEITISAGVVLWKGDDFGPIYSAVQREAERSNIEVRWIIDIVRQFAIDDAWKVVRLAAERVGGGAIAIGIGGDEVRGPARLFGEIYAWAHDHGLRLHAHAGESGGAASVWEALDIGAERIGHGINSIHDPNLVEFLRANQVPLEICLTSNVRTGVVASLDRHPIRSIYNLGVPIILNTDDPALFQTSLLDEFQIAREHFGFSEPELAGIARNAFRFAFDPPRIHLVKPAPVDG